MSAGRWITASKRLPQLEKPIVIKELLNGFIRQGNFYDADETGKKENIRLYIQGNGSHEPFYIENDKFDNIGWLDETPSPLHSEAFQVRVNIWLLECFGEEIAKDKVERNHRFLEEAIELVQSLGCTRSEAHQLVDYTFDRPIGESVQETGGVMVTLAALCLANGLNMDEAGEIELARI